MQFPRLIDLSMTLDPDTVYDPPARNAVIERISHAQAGKGLTALFEGLEVDDLPDGEGCAIEKISLSTHHGTHLDAPFHHHSTSDGRPSPTIDSLPLEWCYAPGVKLDLRHLEDGRIATAEDLQAALERIGHTLAPYEIVLVNTSAGQAHGASDYFRKGCGFDRKATEFLLEAGVRVVGTDAASWDIPIPHMIENYRLAGNSDAIFQAHKVGRDTAYCQLEKLANLEALPGSGFLVCCFPYKIKGASAGFTRAVAILN